MHALGGDQGWEQRGLDLKHSTKTAQRHSGSVLDPDRFETVLRVTCPKMRETEKRTGQAVPSTNRTGHPKPLLRPRESSLNKSRTPLRRKMNFWKTLRKTTATVQTRKCVLPPRQYSLLVGVRGRYQESERLPGSVVEAEWKQESPCCSRRHATRPPTRPLNTQQRVCCLLEKWSLAWWQCVCVWEEDEGQ